MALNATASTALLREPQVNGKTPLFRDERQGASAHKSSAGGTLKLGHAHRKASQTQ